MTHRISQTRLDFHPSKPVDVRFDVPQLSSDAGGLLLRQVDDRLGLTKHFAALLPDDRNPNKVVHDRLEQLRQRVYSLCLGYQDTNDAHHTRHDPIIKLSCDASPYHDGLSSQPTLSRFDNAFGFDTVRVLIDALETTYIQSLPSTTDTLILDIDGTADPVHGQQELAFFHAYHDERIYLPLCIFDQHGQLVTVILRPGNVHDSRCSRYLLDRLICRLKTRLPDLDIIVRGDSHFAMPANMDLLEDLNERFGGIHYVLGLAKNARLKSLAQAANKKARIEYECRDKPHRVIDEVRYAARTWRTCRRIIIRAEHSRWGENPRFVVTNIEHWSAAWLYEGYCQRGQAENWIKDLKTGLFAERLSCSRFVANFVRLMWCAVAYRLMHAVRKELEKAHPGEGKRRFETVRLRYLKVGALVVESARRVLVRLPQNYGWRRTFKLVLAGMGRSP